MQLQVAREIHPWPSRRAAKSTQQSKARHLGGQVLDGGVVEAAPRVLFQHSYAPPGRATVYGGRQGQAAAVDCLVVVGQEQHAGWQRCQVHLCHVQCLIGAWQRAFLPWAL